MLVNSSSAPFRHRPALAALSCGEMTAQIKCALPPETEACNNKLTVFVMYL